jgi:hypothetical protein
MVFVLINASPIASSTAVAGCSILDVLSIAAFAANSLDNALDSGLTSVDYSSANKRAFSSASN